MASSTSSASKAGSTTSDPPSNSVGSTKAMPAWLSGLQTRNRISSGHCHSAIWIWATAAALRKDPVTPFGRPVVPPV